MAQYNLTDNTEKAFTFKIGELEYSFRYPTTAEMRDLSKLNTELQELADKKADEADESEAKMNELVTPIDHDNPISEVLEAQPLPVVRNFRKMMTKEINLG
jgi:hypothetical protein